MDWGCSTPGHNGGVKHHENRVQCQLPKQCERSLYGRDCNLDRCWLLRIDMKHAIFNADGFPTAFYSDELHGESIPSGAIPITEGQWQELVDNQGLRRWADGEVVPYEPPAPPPSAARVYKATMFRKMTDAEYEAYLQIRAGFPPRLQAIFDAAEYLSSDDEFWPALVAAAEQAYGAERAAEILAPTV